MSVTRPPRLWSGSRIWSHPQPVLIGAFAVFTLAIGLLVLEVPRLLSNAVSGTWGDLLTITILLLTALCWAILPRLIHALIADRKKAEALFDSAADGMIVFDVSGTIESYNYAARRIFGYQPEDVLGRSVAMLVPTTPEGPMPRDSGEFAAFGLDHELLGRRQDGSVFPMHMAVSLVRLEGRIVYTAILHDLSKRINAEQLRLETERLFHQIWDASRDGMRLTDQNGIVVMANNAYCQLVKLPRDEIVGRPFSEAYDPARRESILAGHHQRFVNRTIEPLFEREMTFWDGRTIRIELSNTFLEFPGKPPLVLSLLRDISHRGQDAAISSNPEPRGVPET